MGFSHKQKVEKKPYTFQEEFGYHHANPLVNANRLRTSKLFFENVTLVELIIEKGRC